MSVDSIRPTVQQVADLVRVRVVHEGGETTQVVTFDATTWPTSDDVERLIDQGTNAIWTQVPGSLAEPWPPAAQHLAALYTAILIETSYFREQLTDDMVSMYRDLLTSGIKGLGASVSASETNPSRHVDTVVMRSVMTASPEYLLGLDYPGVGEALVVTGPPGPAGPEGAVGPTGPAGPAGNPASLVANPYSGHWFSPWPLTGGPSGMTVYPDRLLITRVVLVAPCVKTTIEVSASPPPGAKLRILAYADTPTGPGTLVQTSADIDASTRGPKQVPFVLPAGPIWLAFQCISDTLFNIAGAAGQNPHLPGIPNANLAQMTSLGTYGAARSAAGQGTTPPNPCPWPPAEVLFPAPIQFFQAA